jgi:hypothetical protein
MAVRESGTPSRKRRAQPSDKMLTCQLSTTLTLGRGAKPPQATSRARAGLESGDPQSLDPNKAMKPMAVWESRTAACKRRAQRCDKMLTW